MMHGSMADEKRLWDRSQHHDDHIKKGHISSSFLVYLYFVFVTICYKIGGKRWPGEARFVKETDILFIGVGK